MAKAGKIVSTTVFLLLIVLAVALSPMNASASSCLNQVWVAPPPFGNDGNPGTQAQPFATIQHGIDTVCIDGTVYVAAGTYHENLEIGKSLTMIGEYTPTTIIDGSQSGRVLHISSATGQTNTISNFTIQNGRINWGCPGMPVGGGVYVAVAHIVTMNDCTIRNNIAEFLGGGVYNAGQITLNRCTASGNSAGMVGGGIANFMDEPLLDSDGTMFLTNCTISGNSVGQTVPGFAASLEQMQGFIELALGGGVYNGGDASFLNVTIANNTVFEISEAKEDGTNFWNVPVAYAEPIIPEPHGGGFANVPLQCGHDGGPIYTPVATFKNTIVANNVPENGFNDGGIVISSGHNLDSENSCGFNQPTDLINTNPLLGPLQDNGGPTFTCALLEGSPAIDAGDNAGAPTTDQRGISRPNGAFCDIGAYELEKAAVPTLEPHPGYSPPASTWTRLTPPTMSVQFVSVNPQQAIANKPVTISTNVVNAGDEGGNYNVILKINGQVEKTRMVSVGPMAAQPIKFTVTRAQPGTYSVDIGGQTGSFTIPDTGGSHRAPVSGGFIAFLVVGLLVIVTVMVLILSRRTA